jgi:hypothetical protein
MLFNSFSFATRRFGSGNKAYLDPTKSVHGIIVGLNVVGRIGTEYIFQRSNGGFQRKRYKKPTDPKSAGQLAMRSKFADAVAWAKSLTGADKQYYIEKVAQRYKLPGYPHSKLSGRSWFNWAISDYMASH